MNALVRIALLMLITFTGIIAQVPAGAGNPLIREEQHITIDGVDEVWRLQWDAKPHPQCTPSVDKNWYICPCNPFAYGEAGPLSLIRLRNGLEYERLKLTGYFTEDDDNSGTEAAVQRHEPERGDFDRKESLTDKELSRRPLVRLMQFKDYDHDGHATEFMLRVANVVCGHELAIVVGVSDANPHIHVFGEAKTPDTALKLQPNQWAALAKGESSALAWGCGDHGADTEGDLGLQVSAGNISVKQLHYACQADGSRGRQLSDEEAEKPQQPPE